MTTKYKMLGVVTLYNPDIESLAHNMSLYVPWLDELIVWDNSPLEQDNETRLMAMLPNLQHIILWHGTGQNLCIAPAINHAWQYALDNGYDMLLIMDQDSQWGDFRKHRMDVECLYAEHPDWTFLPFVEGCDLWDIKSDIQKRRLFINSGTIIPVNQLTAIGGADEAFPLDALDHDLAVRLQKSGVTIVALTANKLKHSLGTIKKSERFGIMTNDYGRFRTYSIARGHIINLRKHWNWWSKEEKKFIIRNYYINKVIQIVFLEEDKLGRLWNLLKGTMEGLTFRIKDGK